MRARRAEPRAGRRTKGAEVSRGSCGSRRALISGRTSTPFVPVSHRSSQVNSLWGLRQRGGRSARADEVQGRTKCRGGRSEKTDEVQGRTRSRTHFVRCSTSSVLALRPFWHFVCSGTSSVLALVRSCGILLQNETSQ